ncbi:MAG: hypothetical protein A2231_04090 [Candidatus Firestonebacteria bacterium RIFOXYA2_FULL_40_8]|nr:MAG: hypothetical protein A2231_04090 [Candidatus Firestonebacteria bacterium RIFOXYA2_FULL_40_8]
MRILINATNIGERLSGLSVYTLSLLREIVKLDKNNEYLIILNKSAIIHMMSIEFPSNFKVKYISNIVSPDHGTKGHLLRLLYSNYLGLRYRKYLIFTTSQMEAIIFHPKQIITVQDVIPLMDKNFQKKQYHYYKYILNIAVRKALAIFTPSEFTKKEVLKHYPLNPDKIHVTPLGIQGLFYEEIEKKNTVREKYILYVGRIAPTKNVFRLLDAYNLIKNKVQEEIVVVGSVSKEYLDSIKDKGLVSEKVTIKENAKLSDILSLYKKAALFVFPTLYEGFGLPPIEAMACGCPVVVSNTTSLPEVCGDAAIYVDPTDIKSIADGIVKGLNDMKLREDMIKKGFERAKQFTWEKTAKTTIEIIKRLDK